MKKWLAGFICLILLLSVGTAFAYDGGSLQYQHALNFLKGHGIVTQDIQWEFDQDFITRREALQIIDNTTQAYRHIALGQTMQEVLGFSFVDITDDTEDAYLSMGLCRMGLFNGRFDKAGNRIADLDGYITNNEGLALLTRMLSMYTVSSEYSEELLCELLGGSDDWLYIFAQRLNLINSDNPLDYGVMLSPDEKNVPMKASTFVRLMQRTLYTPITSESSNFALLYWIDMIQSR